MCSDMYVPIVVLEGNKLFTVHRGEKERERVERDTGMYSCITFLNKSLV